MIEIKEVSFRYEGTSASAIRDITIEFEGKKIYGVIGPNGSGKSTLLRLLNGLIPHFYRGEMKGRVLVDGIDTREASVAQLARKVGLVFQNPEHMFFSDTVYEEVSFGPKSLGINSDETRELVRQALEEVGLWEMRNRSPWSLSGGEMKRLSIACILAMKTGFLAVDEPTIGQDSLSKESLIQIFRGIREEGRGVIIVTHDLEWLEELNPDILLVLKRGSIINRGRPNDVFSDIRGLATNGLIPPYKYIIKSLIGD